MTIPAEFTAEVEQAATLAGQAAAATANDDGGSGSSAFVPDKDEEKNDDGDNGVAGEGGGSDPGTGEGGEAGSQGEGDGEGELGDGGDGGTANSGQGGISSSALARAIRAGLRVDEAIALGTDARVDEVVTQMESDEESRIEAEQAAADAEAESERIAAERKKLEDEFPALDPDETDPAVIAAFDKLKAQFKAQQDMLDAFGQQQAEQARLADETQRREIEDWFAGQLSDLNKTFSEALGKDEWETISLDSKNGDLIAAKMAALYGSYSSQGQKAPPREELFADAARLVLRDDFARADEARLAGKVEKRKQMEINPPGGSKGKTEKSPVDATADLIDKRFFKR